MKQQIYIPPNINLTGKLFDHQKRIVKEAFGQPRYIAAWDMGTGKTIFAIERDLQYRVAGYVTKTLIIAPHATHDSWRKTIHNGTPYKAYVVNRKGNYRKLFLRHLKDPRSEYTYFIINIEGIKTKDLKNLIPCKKRKCKQANKCTCKLKTYDYLLADPKLGISHLILDECHSIKSRNIENTLAVKKITNDGKIKFVTDMSGSPVTNNPDDLWSILNHIKPVTYGRGGLSYWKFFDKYVDYTIGFDGYRKIKGPSEEWLTEGLLSIKPFYSRVLKSDVLDLPEILEENLYVDLYPKQRKLYDDMDSKMVAWIDNNKTGLSEPMISKAAMVQMQRLQIFALGTPSFTGYKDPENKKGLQYLLEDPSAKLDLVIQILEEYAPQKFVIFSQFAKPIALLAKKLEARKKIKNKRTIEYVEYSGNVPDKKKPWHKEQFITKPEIQAFIGTIGSAGTGMDGLQQVCSHMIFLDRAWGPTANEQAISRLHRQGQKNHITLLNVIANDTIDEERIKGIQSKYFEILKTVGDIDAEGNPIKLDERLMG